MTRMGAQQHPSLMDSLKNLSDFLKVLDVSLFGLVSHLVQPADRSRFQAGLGGVVFRVNDLDLHRVLTTSYPTFSLLASLSHRHSVPNDKTVITYGLANSPEELAHWSILVAFSNGSNSDGPSAPNGGMALATGFWLGAIGRKTGS